MSYSVPVNNPLPQVPGAQASGAQVADLPDGKPRVRHVPVAAAQHGQRIDNFLLRLLPGVPKSHVYRILRSGQVRVDGARAKPDRRLAEGESVRVPPVVFRVKTAKRPPDALMRRLREQILAEDEHYVVIDKPAGLPSHGGTGTDFGVIEVVRAWERFDSIELAHRLDRDTSGVLLLARSRPALLRAQRAFRDGRANKRYLAFLCGRWRGGARDVRTALSMERNGNSRRARADAGGKEAVTWFTPLTSTRFGVLCEVAIGTGRMHQIRAHAEQIGHPVAGDRKYGDRALQQRVRQRGGLGRLFLHAHRLELPADGDFPPLTAESPLPPELREAMTRLERG